MTKFTLWLGCRAVAMAGSLMKASRAIYRGVVGYRDSGWDGVQ
jgi:hypothetical protein